MNLIALYGPPAVGKLTVTKELVRLTNYKRFDNHRIADVAADFFDFETPELLRLLRRVQLVFFEAAASGGIPGVIYTFVYEAGRGHRYLDRFAAVAEQSGGRACFVRLYCERDELLRRVTNESRKETKKLTSPAILDSLLPRYATDAEVPFGERFAVDTGRFTPEESAATILSHFGLP